MRIVEYGPVKLDMPDEMQMIDANGAVMVVNPRKNLMEIVQGMSHQELEQLYADYRSRGRYRYGMRIFTTNPNRIAFPVVYIGGEDKSRESPYTGRNEYSDPILTAIPEAMVRGWKLAKKLGRALDEA